MKAAKLVCPHCQGIGTVKFLSFDPNDWTCSACGKAGQVIATVTEGGMPVAPPELTYTMVEEGIPVISGGKALGKRYIGGYVVGVEYEDGLPEGYDTDK